MAPSRSSHHPRNRWRHQAATMRGQGLNDYRAAHQSSGRPRRHGLSSRQRVRMLAIMAALPKEGPPPEWSLPRSMLMRPPSRLHAAMALRVTSPLYQACGVISFEMCHQWSSLAARERATRRTHSHCGTRPRRMMDCAGLAGLPFPIRLSFCFGGVIHEKARNKSHRASSKFHR